MGKVKKWFIMISSKFTAILNSESNDITTN